MKKVDVCPKCQSDDIVYEPDMAGKEWQFCLDCDWELWEKDGSFYREEP